MNASVDKKQRSMQTDNDQAQRKIGRGFWLAAWICVLVLLVTFFDDKLAKQYNPNAEVDYNNQDGIAIVELKRNRYGHYVANGYINGKEVTFMVDTGATNVAIPESVANYIGLERGQRHESHTANGISYGFHTRLNTLSIGAIELNDVNASIMPNFPGNEILLGMSALKQVEFTQRGNTLTLKKY